MVELINLRRARKARVRAEAEKQAAENRVRFGMRKDEKTLAGKLRDKAERDLEGNRRENGGDETQ